MDLRPVLAKAKDEIMQYKTQIEKTGVTALYGELICYGETGLRYLDQSE